MGSEIGIETAMIESLDTAMGRFECKWHCYCAVVTNAVSCFYHASSHEDGWTTIPVKMDKFLRELM